MSEDPIHLVERGDVAYRRKDYNGARELYEKALSIAKEKGKETNYIYSSLVRVYKRGKLYKEAMELARQALPTPAGFEDCAICLRAIVRDALARHDTRGAEDALRVLYRIATLAAVCYGAHDCRSAVSGKEYERAILIAQALPPERIADDYQGRGAIAGGLLTRRDYRLFEDVFGAVRSVYDPREKYRDVFRRADEEAERRDAESRRSWFTGLGLNAKE